MNERDNGVASDVNEINIFQAVAEKFAMGLFVVQDGVLRFANRQYCHMLGYADVREVLEKSFLDTVCPEDRHLLDLNQQDQNSAEDSGFFTLRLRTKSGKTLWGIVGINAAHYRGRLARIGFLVYSASVKTIHDTMKRYEAILNNADLHLSEIDLDANMTFINDAGCRMWGLPRESLVGQGYQSKFGPERIEEARKIFREIYRTGKPVRNLEYEYARSDGELRMVEDSISLVRNPDGDISGFVMAIKDITDRKKAETKINEQRLRLEAIFGSVQDAIIMFDPELRVIEANKSSEKICGVLFAEMTGREFSRGEVLCGHACYEILNQTLSEKKAFSEHRIECERRDYPNQVVSVSSSPLLDQQGNFMGAVLVVRDITLLRDLERELRERNRFQNLIGRNKTMQDIYALLEDLANLETTVLVTGESGTGKELVARALHYSGNRSFKPFVTVNCSALTESLLESELFGHVRGAFTGAFKDKQGRFAAANGGTILLDEIGDISPLIQLKLLRVLQEKEFERVGESIPQKVDVRVIACTNKDLKEKVKRGEFRQDLYYRLKVVEVNLPPLRKRLEDIPLLVDHFRLAFNEKFHKNIEGISTEVLNAFMGYSWPGNVRELEHVMEHAFVLCRGLTITMSHLPSDIRDHQKDSCVDRETASGKRSITEQDLIDALNRTGWNKAKAARILGVSRTTIYHKIERYECDNG